MTITNGHVQPPRHGGCITSVYLEPNGTSRVTPEMALLLSKATAAHRKAG